MPPGTSDHVMTLKGVKALHAESVKAKHGRDWDENGRPTGRDGGPILSGLPFIMYFQHVI